jgi:hypothetical protein
MATVLTLHPGGTAGPTTGEEVFREGARLIAEHFREGLERIPADDPLRAEVEELAATYTRLGAM